MIRIFQKEEQQIKIQYRMNDVINLNPYYFKVTPKASMPGIKKADGPHKYNKVNQQKKYHLLTLFYKRSLSLREAAEIAGINYLTAKTILFFHKNNHKSYQFDLQIPQAPQLPQIYSPHTLTASYTPLKKKNPVEEKLHYQKTRLEIICSIGNVLTPPNTWQPRPPPNDSLEHMFNLPYSALPRPESTQNQTHTLKKTVNPTPLPPKL